MYFSPNSNFFIDWVFLYFNSIHWINFQQFADIYSHSFVNLKMDCILQNCIIISVKKALILFCWHLILQTSINTRNHQEYEEHRINGFTKSSAQIGIAVSRQIVLQMWLSLHDLGHAWVLQ